jgi:hypothetical protein
MQHYLKCRALPGEKHMKRNIAFVLFFIFGLAWLPGTATADDPPSVTGGSGRFADRFSWDLRALAYGIRQETADSTQNPSNRFLNISAQAANFEIRPDLRLNLDRLELSAKPRMRLSYSTFDNNGVDGQSQWKDEWYLNEWLARFRMKENLFVSYGRENLQWGPSFLFSPSNPFFVDNGRRNTYMEVPGMDFGRAVWLPGGPWSVSFIANSGEGANKTMKSERSSFSIPLSHFERTYAVKADYTGREKYASLIFSRKEDSETAIGFYGGWTATDAVLLYGEGAISRGSRALYAVENQSPFGYSMETLHKRDSALYPIILAGASYTFMSKGALVAEYAYHSPGYTASEADRYYTLRRRAAAVVESGGVLSGWARQILGMTALNGLRFQRRNYMMAQYSQPDIANRFDLTFRYTQNLDDGSGQLTSILGCLQGKHMKLFSVGTFMAGNRNREFTSILDRQWQFGLQYTY